MKFAGIVGLLGSLAFVGCKATHGDPPYQGLPESYGTVQVDTCVGLSGNQESCNFAFQWDSKVCDPPCDRLSLYFSGGTMACPAEDAIFDQLRASAERGYIGVCGLIFETSEAAATVPRNEEAPRYDALVQAIVSDSGIQALWNGKELLLTGVSHGGSGPVVAMARNDYDATAPWQGTDKTGACFFDGTYDAPEAVGFLYDNECTTPVSYQRFYDRYCDWPTDADSEVPATWPAPETCTSEGLQLDTVSQVSVADELEIRDWMFVECGSEVDPCSKDVLPRGSIDTLANQINAAEGYTATVGSRPLMSHTLCGGTALSIDDCLDWFEAL